MMSDTSLTRRGFLTGVGASVAASTLGASFAQAQTRANKPYRYLITADGNHLNQNIRYLNDVPTLKAMKRAGLDNIYLELPVTMRKLRHEKPEVISWHVLNWYKKAGYETHPNRSNTVQYVRQLAQHVNAIESAAQKAGMRVHYIDPMPPATMLKHLLDNIDNEANYMRIRRSVDPQMIAKVKGNGPGVVFIGADHASAFSRALSDSKVIPLHQFASAGRQIQQASITGVALTPG